MAEQSKTFQLKTFFSPALVRRLAGDLTRVHPAFPAKAFVARATTGLEDLELLDRGRHIARALEAHLPSRYADAIEVLLASLGPEHATDELIGAGMAPFFYLPHTLFVATRGLDDFDVSMRAQYELTKRFSAESSIRPFIAAEPERTMAVLHGWARDANAHVRRLASEGTRLRLPWAMRVAWLEENPDRVIALLELLKDDPASLVRRSVANNLNDLGKVHVARLLRTCSAWLDGATPDRRALVEHALRGAIKRGDKGALRLLGYGAKPAVEVTQVAITPKRVAIGGKVNARFVLKSRSRSTQDLLVDLGVHFVKGSGKTTRKVFKLKRISLKAGGEVEFVKAISLAVHTTRKPHAGRHVVDVILNGASQQVGAFSVVARSSRG